ncbi:MAG: ATP-dependent Clp protease proteolytic subunit [Lachnospiraceae bacterium]|nr:ATP-dependent Clp protease proteolytic subunit [Lachnospiraceae bacterium]
MYVQERSSHGITLVPLESRLLSERKIFLEGEINSGLAMEFIRQLMCLVSEDSQAPIRILINSTGGEINSGMLIYDAIQSCKTPLKLYCLGRAYSMAAVIFASGSLGKRYLFANSELMVHEPLLGNGVSGNSTSIQMVSESLLEARDKINKILQKHTGRPGAEVEEAVRHGRFFQPQEAIAFGLADHVAGFTELALGE